MKKRIRVLVVDDSPLCSAMLGSMLNAAPDLMVIGTASSGAEAIALNDKLRPDLITMDVQMPGLDGFATVQEIMTNRPVPILVVTAEPVHQGRDRTFQALAVGALDLIRKPNNNENSAELLREKVRILSGVRVVGRRLKVRLEQVQTGPPLPSVVSALPTVQHPIRPVLAITASTGGPKVLLEVLGALPSDYPSGVLVTQHIPEGFSAGFATWLDSELELEVREAEEGDEIRPGRVLVAPSNAHLVVRSPFSVGLSWAEPYNSCRPSGTVMFRSLAQVCPRATIGVLLTGMGRDGADGLMDLRRAGGLCVAQDEASSLVFGMPKAAIDLGAAERILDIQGLITFLRGLA